MQQPRPPLNQAAQTLQSKIIPFDPSLPYSRSSIPPTFLLALLAALVGIPLYLALNGAFSSKGDRLEDGMKSQEVDDEDLLQDEDEGELNDGMKRKKKEKDLDEPDGILEFDDLKSLGGLVGLAALVVLAFAVFPEELNGVVSSFSPGTTMPIISSLWNNPPAEAVGTREETFTEKIVRTTDGQTSGYKEHTVKDGQAPPADGSSGPAAGGILGGSKLPDMLGGRSMIDLMILCKMDPDRCADMGLPFGSKSSPPVVQSTEQIGVQREEILEEIMEILPSESYLSVLRAHPLLLVGLSEEGMSTTGWVLLGLSIVPLMYGFGELSFQAGKKQEVSKTTDKRQAIEAKAIKDIQSYENSSAVYKARAEVMQKERREIEAIAEANHPTKPWRDAMKDRPWWAGREWTPPVKPTDEEVDRRDREYPEGVIPAVAKYFQDEEGKRKKDYGTRHFKLGWNAEELEKKEERYEADKARLAARWGDGKTFKGPYKGFQPIFQDLDAKGREAPKSNTDILKAISAPRVTSKVASAKASELRKFREEGKTDRKTKQQVMPKMSEIWEKQAEKEREERMVEKYQSWHPVDREPARKQEEDDKKQAAFAAYKVAREENLAKQAAVKEEEAARKRAAALNPQTKERFWKRTGALIDQMGKR